MRQRLKRILIFLHVILLTTALLPESWSQWAGKAYAASSSISTVAGTGVQGYSGDGGEATQSQLQNPWGVAVDDSGNVFIVDNGNHRVRKIATDGTISTVAGTGEAGYSGDGGEATSAKLHYPIGVAIGSSGNVYIADRGNNRIRKIAVDGTISTVAGTGVPGYSGDGGAATESQLQNPVAVAVDDSGNVFIADSWNNRIRKIATDGTITTVAGTGETGIGTGGYSGDGGPATSAQLNNPFDVAVDSNGNLYIADSGNSRIRKVATDGTITTVAGTSGWGYSGDGGAATSAKLYNPIGVAIDSNGNIFIADRMNHRIRKVTTDGIINTVAGTGNFGYSGDGGAATSAQLNNPARVAVDSSGNILIADNFNHRIRKVVFIYEVNFDSNGGTPVDSQTVNGGDTATEPAAPTRVGYTFDGWYEDIDLTIPFDFSTPIFADTPLYAKWQINKYTVSFDSNGGSAIETQTVDHGDTATEPGAPTRTGYTFEGWYEDIDLTTPFDFTTPITEDTTLYAKWQINTYTLNYAAGANGTITGNVSQTVNHGANGTAVTAVPDEGYHFVKWSDGNTEATRTDANVTANVNVTAEFAINTYTLTYTAGANGSISGNASQTVNHGTSGTAVTAVPDEGYHFVKWSDGNTDATRTDTNVTANVNVTAEFAINTHTLTYTAGANGTISGNASQTVNHGSSGAAVTAVPDEGYHFVKWSDGNTEATRTDANVTANVNVTAEFAINTYTLTYTAGANGSITGDASQTLNHGGNGTAVTAVPDEGYHFVKWSDGNTDATRTDTNVTANVNVIAEFAINSYTVSFDSNGGSAVDSQTVNHSGMAVEPEAPTRTGHTFEGWFSDEDLTDFFDFGTPITKDTTLYAKWQIHRYTVSFESNGGTAVESQTVNYGGTATEPETPTQDGYTFDGWYVDEDLTVPFAFSTPITGDTILYAKWVVPEQVIKPKATPSGRSVPSGTQVTLSTTTAGATIYYTTDGSTPSSNSTEYIEPIEVTAKITLKAIAVKAGMIDSDVMTEHYAILSPEQVAKPKATPAGGTVPSGTEVTLSTTTDGATIYYATDGSEPSVDSPEYTGPIEITEDMTLKAFAVKAGMIDSEVMTEEYKILRSDQVAKPKATPSGGAVPFGTKVKLSTTTDGATIYYTTDGGELSLDSTEYTRPIVVREEMTLKAFAVMDGMTDSEVMAEHYTIATFPAPANLTASAGDRSVTLRWSAVRGLGSVTYAVYQVEGSSAPDNPADWALVQSNVTANTYTVTGLTNRTTYSFAVKAVNSGGESDFSNVATATPRASGGDGGSGGGRGSRGSGSSAGGDSGVITSTNGTITIPVGRIGDVSLGGEIVIKVPNGAARKELRITIEKLPNTASLLTDEETLASQAFEILKNFSGPFQKPISLSIKFDSTKVGENQKVAIHYYDEEENRWIEVGGTVKGEWITAEIDHFTKFAVLVIGAKEPTFTDIAGHWGERSIIRAAGQKLVKGYPDWTFKPNDPVTRAEFTVMLVDALKLDGTGPVLTFTDQAKIGAWANRAIAVAVQAGIVTGYEDGSFRPDAQVTRTEMASMIARALALSTDSNATTDFVDDSDIPQWAKGAVEAIRKLGIVSGRGGNLFVPNDTATRTEAVIILLRTLEHKPTHKQ